MVEIGDHAVADIADAGRQQGQSARRHVNNLARKFTAVRQHIAAEQVDADALMAPAFLGMRQRVRFGLRQRHAGGHLGKEIRP